MNARFIRINQPKFFDATMNAYMVATRKPNSYYRIVKLIEKLKIPRDPPRNIGQLQERR